MANKTNPHNKFIQFLTLSVLLLGLGTSALLVQQKMYNSKAAVGAPPPPVCPADKPFFCGGCINACTNTGSLNCTQYIALHCGTPQPATPRPPTAPPSASCFTSQVGAKRCSGNYVQTCLSNLQWANTQLCSGSCSSGACVAAAKTPTPTFLPNNPYPPTSSPKAAIICTANSLRCMQTQLWGPVYVQYCDQGTAWLNTTNPTRFCEPSCSSSDSYVYDGKSLGNTRTCVSKYSGNY